MEKIHTMKFIGDQYIVIDSQGKEMYYTYDLKFAQQCAKENPKAVQIVKVEIKTIREVVEIIEIK